MSSPSLTQPSTPSPAETSGFDDIGLAAAMPALRHDLIDGADIKLFYGILDPVDVGMHSNKAHIKLMLLFEPAVCDVTWRTDRDTLRHERLSGAQLCIVNSGVELALRWKEKAAFAVFYVLPDFLRSLRCGNEVLRGIRIRDLAFVNGHDVLARHLTSVFETMCPEKAAHHDRDLAVAVGRALTARLLKFHIGSLRRSGRDGRLSTSQQRKVNEFFEANLHRRIENEELMGLVFLSKAHFIRIFTRTYGAPPVRNHLFRRLKRAETMLLRTDCTILDAVERFGFGDQSYFNRAFLKFLKYRPGALLRHRSKRLSK
jgi:AraC-like DNA-binding protein